MSEKCKNCGDRLFDEDGQSYGRGGYCQDSVCQQTRADAAEQRAADLAESNREQAETIKMLRTELDLANAHAARLMQERDEARRQLVEVTAIKNDAITANEKLVSKTTRSPTPSAHATGGSEMYIASGDSDGWVVTEDGGVIYEDLTENEANKLAEHMNRTGKWSYADVWEYMGWERP